MQSIAPQNMVKDIPMSAAEFKRLSQHVYSNYGIKLPETKLIMVKSRLQKRLRKLDITSFKAYLDFAFSDKEQQGELIEMVNLLTTNKTDFFREAFHFQYLQEEILPQSNMRQHLRVWSAGSSSGEEAYTIAMSISEFQRKSGKPQDFSILATDLSTEVLEIGRKAIYKEERIAAIPLELKQRYFLRSKDRTKKVVRVKKNLRSKVTFTWQNLMHTNYDISERFDVIFCRNTLIYFDRDTQEKVLNRLCHYLRPEGYLFLGHSESISNLDVPLVHQRPTIFKKRN